jgi:hypothetical protein
MGGLDGREDFWLFRLRLKEFEPEIGPELSFHLAFRLESALPYFQPG